MVNSAVSAYVVAGGFTYGLKNELKTDSAEKVLTKAL